MIKLPKFIVEEIEKERLVEPVNTGSIDYMEDFPKYTFRLHSPVGEEDYREHKETIKIAKKIVDWCNKQIKGTAKLGRTDGKVWYRDKDYGVVHEQFVVIGITDPFNKQIEDMLLKKELLGREQATLIDYPKCLVNKTKIDFEKAKKICHYRCDVEKSGVWWVKIFGENPSKKIHEEVSTFLNKITKSATSVFALKDWLDGEGKAEKISKNERNLYYEGKNCNCWIRFNLIQGDYNMYVNVYEK